MLELIFSPKGYIQRMQYFWGYVALCLVIFIFAILMIVILSVFGKPLGVNLDVMNVTMDAVLKAIKQGAPFPPMKDPSAIAGYGCLITFVLLMLWCKACLMVKRLRDLAVTPWLAIIPFVAIICLYLPFIQNQMIIQALNLITIASFLLCLFWPSRTE